MKKAALFLLLIVLISTASALVISDEAINNVIIPEFNQPAKFELTIAGAEEGSYNIYTLTDVKILPASSFALGPGSKKVEIYIYPTEALEIRGHYSFSYFLKKSDGENYEDSLSVKVVDLKDAVQINSDSNDPSLNKIDFYVRNLENAKLEEIKATFSSVFFDEFEYVFDLEPYEKREFSVPVDGERMKKISAGSYIVSADFETDDGVEELEGKIYLGEKKGVEIQEDSSGILVRTETITKINIGNVQEVVTTKIKKNIFTRLFSSFNQEPDLVDREDFTITYSWTRTLKPAEIFVIKTKTNYIFPILILILFVLIVIGIKRYVQTVVEINKSVTHVRTKGGEFALKVKLILEARREVENVSLIDKIPAVVKVYEKFGTIRPDLIDTKNRRLKWDIGNLAAGEERAFSYMVYSKVGIVGKFSLPPATAVFEKNDQIHEVESNHVFFLSAQGRG